MRDTRVLVFDTCFNIAEFFLAYWCATGRHPFTPTQRIAPAFQAK